MAEKTFNLTLTARQVIALQAVQIRDLKRELARIREERDLARTFIDERLGRDLDGYAGFVATAATDDDPGTRPHGTVHARPVRG